MAVILKNISAHNAGMAEAPDGPVRRCLSLSLCRAHNAGLA